MWAPHSSQQTSARNCASEPTRADTASFGHVHVDVRHDVTMVHARLVRLLYARAKRSTLVAVWSVRETQLNYSKGVGALTPVRP